jgi:hypothetical protein
MAISVRLTFTGHAERFLDTLTADHRLDARDAIATALWLLQVAYDSDGLAVLVAGWESHSDAEKIVESVINPKVSRHRQITTGKMRNLRNQGPVEPAGQVEQAELAGQGELARRVEQARQELARQVEQARQELARQVEASGSKGDPDF